LGGTRATTPLPARKKFFGETKRRRGGKEKGFGEKEFPPRPSEILEIGVGVFSVESPNFFQQTPH